jgi:hypothetical protein
MDSLLYKYVGALAVYKCPADRKTTKDPYGTKGGIPVVRSLSMNCWLNPINAWTADKSTGPVASQVTNFRKLGGILRPSETWVTLDENPASINDGWFVCDPATATGGSWVDLPASYHNKAGGLSFSDGHAEIKKWRDPAVTGRGSGPWTPKDGRIDLKWLAARSTYGPSGPP